MVDISTFFFWIGELVNLSSVYSVHLNRISELGNDRSWLLPNRYRYLILQMIEKMTWYFQHLYCNFGQKWDNKMSPKVDDLQNTPARYNLLWNRLKNFSYKSPMILFQKHPFLWVILRQSYLDPLWNP